MPCHKNRRNSLTLTVSLSDKYFAIKGLVFWNCCDLKPLDLLNGPAQGCYLPYPWGISIDMIQYVDYLKRIK